MPEYTRPLPRINARDPDVKRISPQASRALKLRNLPPYMFWMSGRPVRMELGADGGVEFRELTPDRLTYEITRAADWYSEDKDGNQWPDRPRQYVARDMLAHSHMDLPVLRRFSRVPIYGPDGRLLEAGYHKKCGILILSRPGFAPLNVSEDVGEVEAKLATQYIRDTIFADFPFTGPAELAHAFSALLTPLVIEMILGPTPWHMVEKPAPGTGATLLVQVLCFISQGCWIAGMAAPADESEWRRTILAKLLGRPSVFFVDNIRGRLESAALASAITGEAFEDRRIGSSELATAPVKCLWIGTANNPSLSEEMVRRAIRIRLDAKTARPELRTGFKIPDLKQYIHGDHNTLLYCAFTMIQYWICLGRPKGMVRLGMFESWSETIGGILDVCGIEGFLSDLDEVRAANDTGSQAQAAFVTAWWSQFEDHEVGVAELWPLASHLDLPGKSDHGRRINFGKTLHSLRDRHLAGFRVELRGMKGRARLYRLIPVQGPGAGSDGWNAAPGGSK